jgi:hypothetical protein
MSKGQGKLITIKFTEELVGDVSGNESAFTISGQEYKWVDGPDNNGPLVDKEYTIESVSLHPTEENALLLTMVDIGGRFPSVVGNLTVEYDQTLGNLTGLGGAVESFVEVFSPSDLVPEPNPGHTHTVSVAPADLIVDLIPIQYLDAFEDEGDTVTVAPVSLSVELIHIDYVDP